MTPFAVVVTWPGGHESIMELEHYVDMTPEERKGTMAHLIMDRGELIRRVAERLKILQEMN